MTGSAAGAGARAGGVRLAALDIDGTIIDHDQHLTERVRTAIARLAASGVHVVIATGRSLGATLPILDRLGLTDGWVVCSNGALQVWLDPAEDRGYRVTHVETFDPTKVLLLLQEHLPTALYAVEDPDDSYWLTAPFPEGELDGEKHYVAFVDLLHRPATRVIVRSPDHTSDDFSDLVARVGLHGVNYAVGWTAWLDLAPEGVSKATALERIRVELGVAPQATLAVGDGRNDLEMFAWAGRSVAMGQAEGDVRAAADEVTGTVTDDGLAVLLESITAES